MKKVKILDSSLIEKIYEIEKNSFKYPWKKQFFTYLFKKENVSVYGLFFNKILVGFTVVEYLLNNTVSHIQNLAINPEYQNRGLGSYFLTKMHKNFRNRNVKDIFLEVRTSNKKAIALYKKHHYEIVDSLSNYYENNEDAYRMWFNLEN